MPPMVGAATNHEVLFRPDNLRANLEIDVKSRCYLGMNARVPNVRDVAGEQLERRRPIYLVVVCDLSYGRPPPSTSTRQAGS